MTTKKQKEFAGIFPFAQNAAVRFQICQKTLSLPLAHYQLSMGQSVFPPRWSEAVWTDKPVETEFNLCSDTGDTVAPCRKLIPGIPD